MVLGPLSLLLLLELGLRLAGYGHSMSFFLPWRVNNTDCLVENDRFGWRFFGPDMARAPFPFVIPKVKPPGTTRVFVFGESAAYGDPQPEFGLSRMLQALLEGRYPGKRFEVVNTGMTGIDSHVVLPIARDCAAQDGDAWVIYMGNNEVVGPYGSGTVFGAQAASLAAVRAGVAFKATRLGQALGALVRQAEKRPLNESEWGGMAMFVRNHVRADDPRMATVYHSFEENLKDIIDIGRRHGARVVVSTIARNLKECGPFASDHRPGLPAADLSQWENLFQTGLRAQQAGRDADAIAAFAQAAKWDDTYAELHFRWGQSALALGQDAEAARQFNLACDQDALRFRADTRINQIIRQVASEEAKNGVRFVDGDALVAGQSSHGIPGREFLYEHVHLNFEGNYLIARAVAEQLAPSLPASDHPWPSAADCARRLGWNDFNRREAETAILGRLHDPPFNTQANFQQEYSQLRAQVDALQSATSPEALKQEKEATQAAVAAHPDDWILQENLAHFQQLTGDNPGAAASLQRVAQLLPQSSEAWEADALMLERVQRNDEAAAALKESTRLHPESVVALNSLAELYAREGRLPEAEATFRQVLRLKPYWGPAHLGLGKVLEANGKKDEAQREYEESFKNRVNSSESYKLMGNFALGKGWYGAAVSNYTDSLRLNPSDGDVHFNLGRALDKLDRRAEAREHYEKAVQFEPKLAEAHFCLGLESGMDGDPAAAAKEFAEAVRLKPELIEARLNLGIALCNAHQNDEALKQFQEVLRYDPHNQIALARIKLLHANPASN